MDGVGVEKKDVYYYIHKDFPPIKITETYLSTALDTVETVYLSDITKIINELPPHITFLGWYSSEFNEIFTTDITKPKSSLPSHLELLAKWDINTSFKFKGVPLFDFSVGGINITSQDLIEDTIAYDAKGFPIKGIIANAAEVSF